jgi:Mg/Co/Ni transporter MgtE
MGLPTEGASAGRRRLEDVAHDDVPRCRLDDSVRDVAARVRDSRWDVAVVLNDANVVLGLVGRKALTADGDARVEDAMTPGPSTFRPHVSVEEMAHYLAHNDVTTVLVTRSDGTLVGAARREDLER